MNIIPRRQNEANHRTRGEQSRQVQYLTPMVDVQATEEGYVIRAEMPGVDKGGLEITVENGELTILGHRRNAQHAGELVHREIVRNDFKRVYELDPVIDTSKISARINQGLLILSLPKAERVKPRKISVE
jgi:HSP20 family protein